MHVMEAQGRHALRRIGDANIRRHPSQRKAKGEAVHGHPQLGVFGERAFQPWLAMGGEPHQIGVEERPSDEQGDDEEGDQERAHELYYMLHCYDTSSSSTRPSGSLRMVRRMVSERS